MSTSKDIQKCLLPLLGERATNAEFTSELCRDPRPDSAVVPRPPASNKRSCHGRRVNHGTPRCGMTWIAAEPAVSNAAAPNAECRELQLVLSCFSHGGAAAASPHIPCYFFARQRANPETQSCHRPRCAVAAQRSRNNCTVPRTGNWLSNLTASGLGEGGDSRAWKPAQTASHTQLSPHFYTAMLLAPPGWLHISTGQGNPTPSSWAWLSCPEYPHQLPVLPDGL